MCVPGVEVGAEPGEVQGHLGRRVGAVHDRDEAELAGVGEDLLERQYKAAFRRDVADVEDASPLARGGEESVDEGARVVERQWDRGSDIARA